jgi:predicted NAD/FAD-dependent oxidoreductase
MGAMSAIPVAGAAHAVDARRRALLLASACMPWAGCSAPPTARWTGGWVGADVELGHRLRDRGAAGLSEPALQRRAGALVVGAGVAGLGAARALMRAGVDDVRVFDLEAAAGGNSRAHAIGGIACPLGAHYLPLPGERATEVIELLEEFGLRRSGVGGPAYDERSLCHSPQERLFIDGDWHEGLLPPIDALPAAERASTLAGYCRFAADVGRLGASGRFAIPTARAASNAEVDALDMVTFAHWLDREGHAAPALRWYLDYCCRDDYGAGAAQVSAWAGLHYFASRHGFHAPRDDSDERQGVLTWPEGNAFLAKRLAQPLADRLQPATVALRVREGRHDVSVDVWNAAAQRAERWTAPQVVLAVPLFIAARLLEAVPPALAEAVRTMRHAPWLVANLHLDRPLDDRPGAAPAWDNVTYGTAALGYVDARHQSLLPYSGATVLTAYWALGGASASELADQQRRLLEAPWSTWADAVVQELSAAHSDLRTKVTQIDLMRYGHAMSIPLPGVHSSAALRALADAPTRVHFAHADLSGYSIFEEALYHGARAARAVLRRGGTRPSRVG